MSWTFCTTGQAIAKAGTDANIDLTTSGTAMTKWSDEAEGMIEQRTNTDWTTNHTSLSTSMKNMLSDISSSAIAIKIVTGDISSYPSSRMAETILDVNNDIVNIGIKAIEGKADTLKSP